MTDNEHEIKHTSIAGYLMVFVALMVGTLLTVAISRADLGLLGNATAALAIASCKAGLVLYFFMHLRENAKIITVVAMAGFVFLMLLMSFVLIDVAARAGDGATSIPFPEPWEQSQ